MQKLSIGVIACLVLLILAGLVGGMMLSYMFFGFVFFLGLIGLIESVSLIKWLVYKLGSLFDFMLTAGSIAILFTGGVTAGAAITIGALMFTFIYRPWIKYQQLKAKEKAEDKAKSNINRFYI